eukprot:TRINITY_DN27983_c0_g1_i2.p1 TRINITY_DN27983_c0_g1~~TRINITY_DN27983_c0_g1_i2.p1  ORF type:complete len:276 (+),score=59.87 TRINITY_DN27983_c0_g1_i2:197-1024(+)
MAAQDGMFKTTAAVLRARDGPYRLEQIRLRPLQDDELRVRIAGTGFCHTDATARSPQLPAVLPLVTGHEGAGVVEAVGSAVSDVKIGDHVIVSYDSCGDCKMCGRQRQSYCSQFMPRNLFGNFGKVPGAEDAEGQPVSARWFGQSSFAEHIVTPARSAVVVDKALPLHKLGPLGCGMLTGAGAVFNSLAVSAGDVVAVFGVGGVGLAAVMAAKIRGAERILAIDLHESRLRLAAELGATHTISGDDPELQARLKEAAGPEGIDQCLDTTGVRPFG